MVELELAVEAAHAGREPFEIAHHGARCCVLARAWLERIDSTFHRGRARAAAPSWIGQRFPAGSTGRALHWCEIPDTALGDAAAAALGRELWGLRREGVRAVQLVVRERPDSGSLAYREAIGREQAGRLEIQDCTDWTWLQPPPASRRGPTLWLKVGGGGATLLRWGDHGVPTGDWTAI